MANVSVYNIEGKEVGSIELNDAVFGVEVNEHLVHMAVVNQLANNRQGLKTKVLNSQESMLTYQTASRKKQVKMN